MDYLGTIEKSQRYAAFCFIFPTFHEADIRHLNPHSLALHKYLLACLLE